MSTNTIEILRKTIQTLAQNSGLSPDDPHLAEIKKNVLRVITELEVSKTPQPEGATLEALPAEAEEVQRR